MIRHASDGKPFAALVFKIMTDPCIRSVGDLPLFRNFEIRRFGLQRGQAAQEPHQASTAHACQQARRHQEILAGDICAAVGLTVSTGDTICDIESPVVLSVDRLPHAGVQLAVEPKTKADQEKLGMAIQKLAQEDPTFRVNTDPETSRAMLSGMGELQLEIIVDRMMRKVVCSQRRQAAGSVSRNHSQECPAEPAREADRRPQTIRARQDEVEPFPGGGFEFVDEVTGGRVPEAAIKPAEAGMKRSRAAILARLSHVRCSR